MCIGAWDSGTVGSLEAQDLRNYCTKSKKLLNLLTNFLRSFQVHKSPISDIGTLIEMPKNANNNMAEPPPPRAQHFSSGSILQFFQH